MLSEELLADLMNLKKAISGLKEKAAKLNESAKAATIRYLDEARDSLNKAQDNIQARGAN